MIKILHGELYIHNISNEFKQLLIDFNSCSRYAYNRFLKDDMNLNEARASCKAMYPNLSVRYIYDAISRGKSMHTRFKDETDKNGNPVKVVFGSKKNLESYTQGNITKKEWLFHRNKHLYSRGEANQKGNNNLRILDENTLRISIGNRKFEVHKLFIPRKFKQKLRDLLVSGIAYGVRLTQKTENTFKVAVDYQVKDIDSVIEFKKGCIGIDINPDRVALAEIDQRGQLIDKHTIINHKLKYTSTDKRDYEISLIVKHIIEYAKYVEKGIILEDLKFNKNFKNQGKKFNKTKSNFIYNKITKLLERKCIEHGISYRKVNPAFTSVIGRFKYKDMYNMYTHESAAYVIARRGLYFNERLSLYKHHGTFVKTAVLHLAGKRTAKKMHNWALWRLLRDNYNKIKKFLKIVKIASLQDIKTDFQTQESLKTVFG